MQVMMTRQINTPVLIQDPRENVVVDIENNHVEITLEDKSRLILSSVENYYSFINEFGSSTDISLDNLFTEAKITFVNFEFRESVIKTVCESTYNDEPVWLLRL